MLRLADLRKPERKNRQDILSRIPKGSASGLMALVRENREAAINKALNYKYNTRWTRRRKTPCDRYGVPMITGDMREVLEAADAGNLYWTRKGGSAIYEKRIAVVKEAIRKGFLAPKPMDCCRKDYLITVKGEMALNS